MSLSLENKVNMHKRAKVPRLGIMEWGCLEHYEASDKTYPLKAQLTTH